MRIAAIGLLAAAGCNQIFGLDPVHGIDAPPAPPDAPFKHVNLTFQVAKTMAAAPDPTLEFAPIPNAAVKIGTMTGSLDVVGYNNGDIEIPGELFSQPKWRLEYTIGAGVPHELQWAPDDGAARLVEPMFGRLERTAAPANSGYSINPTGGPASYLLSHVYTTGIWMDVDTGSNPKPITARIDTAIPFTGPAGAPDPAFADQVVLVNYGLDACLHSAGSAGFTALPLVANMNVSATPAFPISSSGTASATYQLAAMFGLPARVGSALGGNAPSGRASTNATRLLAGHIPHDQMPGFTNDSAGVPTTFMVPLADCRRADTTLSSATTTFTEPMELRAFSRGMYAGYSDTRTVNNVDLVSSIAGLAIGPVNQTSFEIDLRVPLAIDPIQLGGVSLSGTTDQVAVPAGNPLAFTFEIESDPGLVVDYYEVEVFELGATTLSPLRIYTIADPADRSVQVDRSLLVAGKEYVLAIRAFRGRPAAHKGDFTTIMYPQAVTTVFTRTFKI
jgi:hypothetical protein